METINFDEIIKNCEASDYSIIGIGELFAYDWKMLESDGRYIELLENIEGDNGLTWLVPFLQKVAMDNNPDMRLHDAYEKLSNALKDCDVYYVTTTIDDYIYKSGMDLGRIVTPCGGFRQLQCENNCNKELINLPFALLQYVQKLYNKMISLGEVRDKFPECPDCGANLVFNQLGTEHYNEQGYLVQWDSYQQWLQKTMNKKVTMVELGAGLGLMSVFRSPFERIATYNMKSTLYRVHPTLYMSTPEIKERCVSVAKHPIDLVLGDQ